MHSAYNFDCSPIWISSINSENLCDNLTFLWCIWKLGKATISFIVSVHLSTWNNSASTKSIFMKFDIGGFIENLPQKIQVSLKSDKNNGYYTWISMYIYDIKFNSFTMKNVSDKVVEKSNTHILCLITFFSLKIVPFMR